MCIYVKAVVAKAADWSLVPPRRPGAVVTLAMPKLHLQVICRKMCLGSLCQGTSRSAEPEKANGFGT